METGNWLGSRSANNGVYEYLIIGDDPDGHARPTRPNVKSERRILNRKFSDHPSQLIAISRKSLGERDVSIPGYGERYYGRQDEYIDGRSCGIYR